MVKILEMRNISKRFPGVLALDGVSLTLHAGEILALLGENGAGKSTLMKILSGAYQADQGEIFLKEEKIISTNPPEMMKKNIAVMHQELSYLNDLSIAENIFLGKLPINKFFQVDYKKLRADTKRLLDMVGLDLDPMTEVSTMTVAQKQMMEIAKALSAEVQVLVLDEPTSALNEAEVQILFGLIRRLAAQGKGIIYISHKMDEIFEISHRIQVLRDGRHIGTAHTGEITTGELVNMMVGRTIDTICAKEGRSPGDVVLEVKNLVTARIKDITFSVRAGEVVGLYGLMGSGRTELVEAIFGKKPVSGGEIRIDGKKLRIRSPRDAIREGIAYIPRERRSEGLVLTESVQHNMSIVHIDKLQKFLKLDLKREKTLVREWIQKLQIKTPSLHTPVKNLSGGNQQKTVIGKWMMDEMKVIILNEPTRGIDVGAKAEVYHLIEELCQKGMAVIMISSETPEIMGVSDRSLVVHEGRITGECERAEFKQETIMHYAIGEKSL
ncbi:sugar ABC transporter ATP-binding protein [Lactonifactor longoviformis]|uniref:sugar ABC transporter ATP-binding protein n=1 Tax=Lactonifactor longoviformis TaxID=341220 RepID=UPI0036F241F0